MHNNSNNENFKNTAKCTSQINCERFHTPYSYGQRALFSPSFLDCFPLTIVMFNPSKNESSSNQSISICRNFVFTNMVTDMLVWVEMLYGSKLWEKSCNY